MRMFLSKEDLKEFNEDDYTCIDIGYDCCGNILYLCDVNDEVFKEG